MHKERIEAIVGSTIQQSQSLSGGMIGQVYLLTLANGNKVVAKVSASTDVKLDIEGRMLDYLNQHSELSVPQVIHSEADLLLMTYIPNNNRTTKQVEIDAANQLAALHKITAPQFGLEFDTLIGGLHQPNTQADSWIDFFREQRLLYMADVAYQAGNLAKETRTNIDTLASKLGNFLLEPTAPALIHGDIWSGNVLANNGKLSGFIDPAIYYAHPEIELAFITLFSTFSSIFFDAYNETHAIQASFFEERRDLYNLYPLLVHAKLFGGGYGMQVTSIVKRYL